MNKGVTVSALTEDELQAKPVAGWNLPNDLDELLALLRQTPSLGSTDRQRARTFLGLPAAEEMPEGLRRQLNEVGYGQGA